MIQVTLSLLRKNLASVFHLMMSWLRFFKNCAETSCVLEVTLANILHLWDPLKSIWHLKLPLNRPLNHQNPSNGSKVMSVWRIFREIRKNIQIGKILIIGVTFEPFDGFWCFWGPTRGNLRCQIHLRGSQSCWTFASATSNTQLVSAQFLKNPSHDIIKWKTEARFFLRRLNVTCITS